MADRPWPAHLLDFERTCMWCGDACSCRQCQEALAALSFAVLLLSFSRGGK